jgi:hypothetical protein
MSGEWFRVRTRGGVAGYINAWDVYVPPRQVSALGKEPVRAQPASGAKPIGTTTPAASYPVKASTYIDKVGLWYQIETPAGTGWVRAFQMRTQFSLPVVHFAAGLYRYQLGRYDDAAREFEQFTRMEGVRRSASLSDAHQLLAQQLMGVVESRKSVAGLNSARSGVDGNLHHAHDPGATHYVPLPR